MSNINVNINFEDNCTQVEIDAFLDKKELKYGFLTENDVNKVYEQYCNHFDYAEFLQIIMYIQSKVIENMGSLQKEFENFKELK